MRAFVNSMFIGGEQSLMVEVDAIAWDGEDTCLVKYMGVAREVSSRTLFSTMLQPCVPGRSLIVRSLPHPAPERSPQQPYRISAGQALWYYSLMQNQELGA